MAAQSLAERGSGTVDLGLGELVVLLALPAVGRFDVAEVLPAAPDPGGELLQVHAGLEAQHLQLLADEDPSVFHVPEIIRKFQSREPFCWNFWHICWRSEDEDANLSIVTGTQVIKGRAGTLELSAYHVRVPWTGERLRRARGHHGLTQDELRRRLGELAADRKQPSGTSISDWETDKTKPGTKWAAVLDQLFGHETAGEDAARFDERGAAVDLSAVSDLELLAEVALRMAGGQRTPVEPMGGPRLRWSRADLPSARRAAEEQAGNSDNEDAQA